MSQTQNETNDLTHQGDLVLSKPNAEDGSAVFDLIARCPPLDQNSMYCNLLQCSHFRDTSVVAKVGDVPVGFISGYRIPSQPDTLFVWQVAVDSRMRGHGLASRMLRQLIDQVGQVNYLHTSITSANQASWRTFERLAKDLGVHLSTEVMFDHERHFDQRHDTEELVIIGPFSNTPSEQS
jgi:L-2,4-diaminobutyric acid acetyltransferase